MYVEMLFDEMEEMEEVRFSRETETALARKHRKGDIKAKHHLAEIAPIQNEDIMPIHRNGNGVLIKRGWTAKSDWKRTDRKANRAAARREIRQYMPETITATETVLTPSHEEMEIAIIRDYIREAEEEKAILERRIANMNRRIEELQAIVSGDARSWSF